MKATETERAGSGSEIQCNPSQNATPELGKCKLSNTINILSFKDFSAEQILSQLLKGIGSVVSFDRSHFQLFSLQLSNKLVQAPSCERRKTAPLTLFLLFAIYNCFPITL